MKRNYLFLILLSLFLIIFGCVTSVKSPEPKVKKAPVKKVIIKKTHVKKDHKKKKEIVKTKNFYTKYNIHVIDNGRDLKAHYTNWIGPFTGHSIIPFNTKVISKKWQKGFILEIVDTGQNIYFHFNKRHMTMPVAQYINLITGTEKILVSQFSNIDKKGIKRGKVYKGMTKKGVLTALGYPAKHKTPSLKNKFWVYWQNKWLTRIIKFNNHGKVISIAE
ncbi:MAG: hypothetical protein KAJ62_14910 [Desulfobacteraceae bacterium]|nr:hypothetical protein [Desulfobacteraceae bacterium]